MAGQTIGTFTGAERSLDAASNAPKAVDVDMRAGGWLRIWASFNAASASCNYELMRLADDGTVEFVKQGTLTGTDRRTARANSSGNYLSDFVDVNTMRTRAGTFMGAKDVSGCRWFIGITSLTTATSVTLFGESFYERAV